MNYRHLYHAGNFADVFKHIIVVALTGSLLNKDTPFCYLDTHAGIGSYDLLSKQAQINKEFELGIKKIMSASNPPELVEHYLACIKKINPTDTLQFYPGSPYFAKQFMRSSDRMVLCELHPEDFESLKKNFFREKNIGIHKQDGFQCLKAFLPPKEKRGIVLIDPPYENPEESSKIIKLLPEAIKRWQTGIFALWYPIKNHKANERFIHSLLTKISQPYLNVGLSIYPEDTEHQLNGNGVLIINPPWMLEEILKTTVSWLWKHLTINNKGRYFIEK